MAQYISIFALPAKSDLSSVQPYLTSVVQRFPPKASEGALRDIWEVVLRYILHIFNCKRHDNDEYKWKLQNGFV